MVDTGSSFSLCSPSFLLAVEDQVSFLPASPSAGGIQMVHSSLVASRLGSINLTIFYNKTILNHNFEVFELFTKSHKNTENIPCLIGMDLLHKLNIGITGLVLTHFEICK